MSDRNPGESSSRNRPAAAGVVSAPGRSTRLLRTVCKPPILIAAGRVSLVVGTVLNLVNQGPLLWQHSGISWPKVLMNYIVPFCVAAYSAAANERRRPRV